MMKTVTMVWRCQPRLTLPMLYFALLVTGGCWSTVAGFVPVETQLGRSGGEDASRFADAAYDFVQKLDCHTAAFSTVQECHSLRGVPRASMNVYLTTAAVTASNQEKQKYISVLPDGGLGRSGAHDAVLAVDPYPSANFGHLVLVFFVDLSIARSDCETAGGTILERGECLQLAVKNRCQNTLLKNTHRRHFARRCEINFLPLVYYESDQELKGQQLRCLSQFDGFGLCPELRALDLNDTLNCELTKNTRRCVVEKKEFEVRSKCKIWEICDQAVVLSGGWNGLASLPRHEENVLAVYRMLRQYGFKKNHVKSFFAESGLARSPSSKHPPDTFPTTHKLSIRNYFTGMCRHSKCVDSLVIYLNSPTKNDGTMLLWDTNWNGMAEEEETYSVDEFLEDTANCEAERVYVIADQSYSGILADKVRASDDHANMAVFASSGPAEYSWGSDYTNYWTTANHAKCIDRVHQESYWDVIRSHPEIAEGSTDAANTTLYGAPCRTLHVYSDEELKKEFMGCQNLPMSIWLLKFENFGNDS